MESNDDIMYSKEKRKKLVKKISNIKDNKYLVDLYEIIKLDINSNISENTNGVFFNVNGLSNSTLLNIESFLNKFNIKDKNNKYNFEYIPYSKDEFKEIEDLGCKLSIQEKNFIKRLRSKN